MWILAGVAQRIGQRIGLHRNGETLKLPPFETEMRRRLWWQLLMLEGYAQLAGTGSSSGSLVGDVILPSNVNDSDLSPGMKEKPKNHEGATEMMFFLIRCHVGEFLSRSTERIIPFDGVWGKLTSRSLELDVKTRAIDELAATLHHKFLQYCDPAIPWHFICLHLGNAIIFMMKFMALGANNASSNTTQQERDHLFNLAFQVETSQNLAYTMETMHGFAWHVNIHFQWKALIFLLSELRQRTHGLQVDQAWKEIEITFRSHPSFKASHAVKALPVAVGRLALKAWNTYVTARGIPSGGEPHFIQQIRRQTRDSGIQNDSNAQHEGKPFDIAPDCTTESKLNIHAAATGAGSCNAADWDFAAFDAALGTENLAANSTVPDLTQEMDWSAWNDLLVDFHAADVNELPLDFDSLS